MEKIRLGRTGLLVTKTAFGALPIQRISKADAVKLVRRACEAGINYFDTANMYTDSEEKLGEALHDVRQNVVISTKSGGGDKKTVQAHIEQSLRSLRTDYIDLFQFHNPAVLPDIHDPDGPFAAALEAKQKGYIRHIGITNHRLKVAHEAIESGNFETLQFPFCYLATEKDLELVELCREHDMGFIAMKALSGGLIRDSAAAYAAKKMVDDICFVPEVGKLYYGKVVRILPIGAFVELAPGKDGMIHISKLENRRVEKVEDVLNIGDMTWVKVTEIDEKGRVNLSRKDALKELANADKK